MLPIFVKDAEDTLETKSEEYSSVFCKVEPIKKVQAVLCVILESLGLFRFFAHKIPEAVHKVQPCGYFGAQEAENPPSILRIGILESSAIFFIKPIYISIKNHLTNRGSSNAKQWG